MNSRWPRTVTGVTVASIGMRLAVAAQRPSAADLAQPPAGHAGLRHAPLVIGVGRQQRLGDEAAARCVPSASLAGQSNNCSAARLNIMMRWPASIVTIASAAG